MHRRFQLCPIGEDYCDFCGHRQWTAEWRAHCILIHICRECALKDIPMLFADATWFPAWRPLTGARNLDTLAAVFWRAQASNCYALKPNLAQILPEDTKLAEQRDGAHA